MSPQKRTRGVGTGSPAIGLEEDGAHKGAVRPSAICNHPAPCASSNPTTRREIPPIEPESSVCTGSCSPKVSQQLQFGLRRLQASCRALYPVIETYIRSGELAH
jgi:hypothetical protein